MNTLSDILFSSVNITLSLLVILLLAYWIVTLLSGIDFDLDVDIDVDVDADIDIDGGIEGGNADFHDISNTEIIQFGVLAFRNYSQSGLFYVSQNRFPVRKVNFIFRLNLIVQLFLSDYVVISFIILIVSNMFYGIDRDYLIS